MTKEREWADIQTAVQDGKKWGRKDRPVRDGIGCWLKWQAGFGLAYLVLNMLKESL